SFAYTGNLRQGGVPCCDGTDFSYPENNMQSADFFFNIANGERPWIAACGRDGYGLVQTSTSLLRGRKLFVWGMGRGGRKWQEFLSDPGKAYIEIQAGLARTQLEHLPMPPQTEWAWTEAYGPLYVKPASVHSKDWKEVRKSTESAIESLIAGRRLQEQDRQASAYASRSPAEMLQYGSGWGALERLRRESAGERPFHDSGMIFPDASLGSEQEPWLHLSRKGTMKRPENDNAPVSFMVQPEWSDALEVSLKKENGAHWLSLLHAGIMRFHAGKHKLARQAWKESLKFRRTPWALRNLAILEGLSGKHGKAAELMEEAFRMRPDVKDLAVECAASMIKAGQPRRWLELIPFMPAKLRLTGRLRLLEAKAALDSGELLITGKILSERLVVDDLQECERSLSDIWIEYHKQRIAKEESIPLDGSLHARVVREFVVPEELDFRMSPAK
ncbi:MAG: DUF5107 domain-containing protein, partial [Victivallaceae bacterium]|nr:DUF5107 domain-containing protein [Victivallaceae bacterium]